MHLQSGFCISQTAVSLRIVWQHCGDFQHPIIDIKQVLVMAT